MFGFKRKEKKEKPIIRTSFDIKMEKYNYIVNIIFGYLILQNIILIILINDLNWVTISLSITILFIIRFYIFKLYKKQRVKSMIVSLKDFTVSIFKQIILTIGVVFVFVIYQNYINPAELGKIYISNGEKEVVFMEMAHIANEDFYNFINFNVSKYTEDEYILFFEGVELDVELDIVENNLGFLPTKETYALLTSSLGKNIISQDNNEILARANNSINTDMRFSEMIGTNNIDFNDIIFEIKNDDKINLDNTTNTISNNNINYHFDEYYNKQEENIELNNIDFEKEDIIDIVKGKKYNHLVVSKDDFINIMNNQIEDGLNNEFNNQEKDKIEELFDESFLTNKDSIFTNIFQNFIRSIFNLSVKHPEIFFKLQAYLVPDISHFFNDKVIDLRNQKLAHNVINSEENKIMITYGALHFKGFFELLKKDDKNWKIIKTEKVRVF